jgi:hypothetical protein
MGAVLARKEEFKGKGETLWEDILDLLVVCVVAKEFVSI